MTTTEPSRHGIARSSGGWLACNCGEGRFSDAEMTRHLLDVGCDEGRQEGYDAGIAVAKGELVTADDPRLKGARARAEFDSANSVLAYEGVVEEWDTYRNGDARLVVANVCLKSATRVYLLAEAPDPDAEVRKALEAADEASCTYAGMLDALRAAGYDIVKAVAK